MCDRRSCRCSDSEYDRGRDRNRSNDSHDFSFETGSPGYRFLASDGRLLRGDQFDYNGVPAGYADSPEEVVNYVDAHDNATLFDMLTLKLPVSTAMSDRVRMNTLSLATVTLAQGVSFWHAGTDLLRSKSLDHNSYDSGDWFNLLDWTGQDNGFGRGLPPAADNSSQWKVDGPLLANPALKPTSADIADARVGAHTLLRLRAAISLFRLGNADLINQKPTFPCCGPAATPGVVVMSIDDTVGPDVDPDTGRRPGRFQRRAHADHANRDRARRPPLHALPDPGDRARSGREEHHLEHTDRRRHRRGAHCCGAGFANRDDHSPVTQSPPA